MSQCWVSELAEVARRVAPIAAQPAWWQDMLAEREWLP